MGQRFPPAANLMIKHEPKCTICNAKDDRGNLLRPMIEAMEAEGFRKVGMSNRDAQIAYLLKYGYKIYPIQLYTHYKKHASYTKNKAEAGRLIRRVRTTIVHPTEGRSTIQKIINYGDKMIENWWNDVEGEPQLPVNQKLLMDAIKEEGRRAPRTAIDQELDLMERRSIEGSTNG